MIRMFESTSLPALEQATVFAQRRHEVLAGNLANLDTPDYRAKDLSVDRFQNALRDSIDQAKRPSPGYNHSVYQQMGPGGVRRSVPTFGPTFSPAHDIKAASRDDFAAGPRQAMEPIVLHDGSDVSIERQVTEIAKNQGLHNVAIATMRSQFALLQAAITERA